MSILAPTELQSVSTEHAPLPAGVSVDGLGLTLPDNLSYEDWSLVGRKLADTSRNVVWFLGDFLAFGHAHYAETHWGGRTPSELYTRLARETGYAEQTLMNARVVCMKLPPSRRRDNLTLSHAAEIVGRCKDPEDYEGWIDYVSQGGVSVKALRSKLREDTATVAPEANDVGVNSVLETTRQFVRDFQAYGDLSPGMRVELRKILGPVIRDLS